MRVLHLYAGNLYGGIETLLVTLARCRDLCPEMQPEFGLCFRGRLWDDLVNAGVTVHDFGAVRLSRPWTVWKAQRKLRHLLAANHFDCVATHACWPHAVFAQAIDRSTTRLIHFVHDAHVTISSIDAKASRVQPDQIIANSHYTAKYCDKVFPTSPKEVVYCPIERRPVGHRATCRERLCAELVTDTSNVVILQVSRMERWKGAWKLLESLGQLKGDDRWTAWIVGGVQRESERVYQEELIELAVTMGIADRVRFVGHRSDVPELMAAADVFCQPNTGAEPFGIVFVEALAAGLPVVTCDIGGGAEIVNSTCGIKVEVTNGGQLANALERLIDNVDDRTIFGNAGPSRASEICDPQKQLTAYHAVMSRAASMDLA
ncbi:glycosyltransferase family 4 protein [Novipirellula sp. SH528]|uniref:glycosyltransferase family 4 protein n=1 Tax=Novipirellula sp. SH528 TaxID=3454466 RepID=UPI003FA128BA